MLRTAVCGVALAGLLSGCAWSIGEGTEKKTLSQPTQGQELIDLKKAKDQGAITDEEYNHQRQKLLNQ